VQSFAYAGRYEGRSAGHESLSPACVARMEAAAARPEFLRTAPPRQTARV
jgi:hypothetical protein